MSADFFSIAAAISPSAGKRAIAELELREERYNDNVYLECGPDEVADVVGIELAENTVVMSSNASALVALDRFGGAAEGQSLLAGHAIVRVPHAELAPWRRRWESVRGNAIGRRKAEALLDSQGTGKADLAQAVAMLGRALADAESRKFDLLMACTVS